MVDLLPKKADSPLQPRYDVWNKSYDRTFNTAKGYKVHERIIFIDGAVSKTAEIFDKAGQKHDYEARFISPKESKYVKEVFGYQFPVDTVIKVKLAPPPPVPGPPAVNQLPAASVPPVKKLDIAPPAVAPVKKKKLPPPLPPAPTKTTKLVQDWPSIPGFFTRTGKGC